MYGRFKKSAIKMVHAINHQINGALQFISIKLPTPVLSGIEVLQKSVSIYRSHDTPTLGAGLSYYMIFSMAPLIIIIISVTGSVFGPGAITGSLKTQVQDLLGSSAADTLQSMITAAYKPGKNWVATGISIILLITGSIGVFDQLRHSLNIIWDVKKKAKKPFLTFMLNRLFSISMIACLTFLLLVSLIIHTLLAALSGFLDTLLPHLHKMIIMGIETVISSFITTVLFTFIFKFMSDIKMKWDGVWWGAVFTAFLFAIGKYLIGLYISHNSLINTYGAASSIVGILVWVFYSSQIFFFGAGFTLALAQKRGIIMRAPGQEV